MATELVQTPQQSEGAQAFALAQRQAQALSQSTLVPEAYRGNVPNVLIAMDMAQRLGASPMLVMQNLHVISGRPSWSASFLIATVNQCGRFTPLRFESAGDDPRTDGFRIRAYAEDKASGERCVGEWVDWALVRGEGWDKKNGSKWRTMPGQMFRYRAAAFWTRVYAPEVSMGILTSEEAADIDDEPVARRGSVTVDLRAKMQALGAEGAAADPAAATGDVPTDAPPRCPGCGKDVESDLAEEVARMGKCPGCPKAETELT